MLQNGQGNRYFFGKSQMLEVPDDCTCSNEGSLQAHGLHFLTVSSHDGRSEGSLVFLYKKIIRFREGLHPLDLVTPQAATS